MKKREREYRYINGSKGAISLFLAVLLTPFLTIAMLLVEVGRYNSCVSILDELMGTSAVSTLADYDQYLHGRWGLMGLSQEKDLTTTYSGYLNTNSAILGDSLQVNSAKVAGAYPLTEDEVLYSQIMEYCKLNAPTTLASNFLNLSSILSSFDGLKDARNIVSLCTDGIGIVDSAISFAEAAEELKPLADDLDTLRGDYQSDYTAYETAVNELIDALNEPRPDTNVAEGESEEATAQAKAQAQADAEAYDQNIEDLREAAKTAKTKYEETLGSIEKKMDEYVTKMAACDTAMANISTKAFSAASSGVSLAQSESKRKALKDAQDKVAEFEKNNTSETDADYLKAVGELRKLESESAKVQLSQGIVDAGKQSMTTMTEGWKVSKQDYSNDTLGELADGFGELKEKVSQLDIDKVDAQSAKVTADVYQTLSVAGYVDSAEIDAYLDQQKEELVKSSLSDFVSGVMSFVNSIFKLKGFYDPELSAYIDVSYYQEQFGGLPGGSATTGGVMDIIISIGNVFNDVNDFKSNIAHLKFLSAARDIRDLLTHIKELFESLVNFALGILENIATLFTSYDRLYYSTYSTFNVPCRTDYKSGLSFTNMTGYKMNVGSLPRKPIKGSTLSPFDDLAALISTLQSAMEGTGSDIVFSGAELEYILLGSNSELGNQLYVFCALYLLRLLLDIGPVLCNAEVQSIAGASTIGYPLVIALVVLIEPLVDALLLVNGETAPLIKTEIYLTPSGIVKLIPKIISVCKLTSDQEKAIKSDMTKAYGIESGELPENNAEEETPAETETESESESESESETKPKPESETKPNGFKAGVGKYAKGLLSFNYREHCFFLLLLTVTKEQQLARLKNLIQMEGVYHYQKEKADYVFDLRHCYTFVDATANVSVKQMLPTLTDSSLFTVERRNFRGY